MLKIHTAGIMLHFGPYHVYEKQIKVLSILVFIAFISACLLIMRRSSYVDSGIYVESGDEDEFSEVFSLSKQWDVVKNAFQPVATRKKKVRQAYFEEIDEFEGMPGTDSRFGANRGQLRGLTGFASENVQSAANEIRHSATDEQQPKEEIFKQGGNPWMSDLDPDFDWAIEKSDIPVFHNEEREIRDLESSDVPARFNHVPVVRVFENEPENMIRLDSHYRNIEKAREEGKVSKTPKRLVLHDLEML